MESHPAIGFPAWGHSLFSIENEIFLTLTSRCALWKTWLHLADMVSVYDYMDYRRFLKESFLEQKQKRASFSFRSFNRRAGIKSSGFLKLVIDGKRNLAEDGIRMLAKGFDLSEDEQRYFEVLVRFNQAKNNEEKDRYFQELSQNKKFLAAKPLTAAQYRLFSHWFYVAILESIRIETEETKSVEWVHRTVHPQISIKLIKRAVS